MFKQCISIGCTVRTHFYYVPVLVYVHIPTVFQHLPAHTSTMFKQFLGVFQHFPCAHPCCTPALLACIPTMFKHFLWTFLLCPAFFSVRIPTVLQHCLRAFLLCSSIFLHAFLFSLVRVHAVFRHYLTRKTIQKYLVFPLQFHYISIIVPSHFHCISCISFPAFLFHCISFPALLASSYLAS